MGYKIPNGGTFQHAATYAAALAFASISNATEAVATVVGGTLAAGDIVLLTSGWSKLDSKVVRVKAATATAITLEGIDTTDTQVFLCWRRRRDHAQGSDLGADPADFRCRFLRRRAELP